MAETELPMQEVQRNPGKINTPLQQLEGACGDPGTGTPEVSANLLLNYTAPHGHDLQTIWVVSPESRTPHSLVVIPVAGHPADDTACLRNTSEHVTSLGMSGGLNRNSVG